MPKYRNIYTGKVEEWTARNELGVMEREEGVRRTIYGFDDGYGQCPSFLSCYEFIDEYIEPSAPFPAPVAGSGDEQEE